MDSARSAAYNGGMGRQWLQKKRGINAEKRAKITSKLAREITVAAKMGAPDIAFNPRLALAVEAARKQSVSNDVIARAIKKGSGAAHAHGFSQPRQFLQGHTPNGALALQHSALA